MADSYQVHPLCTHLLFHDDNSDPERRYTLRADVWRCGIRPSLDIIAYQVKQSMVVYHRAIQNAVKKFPIDARQRVVEVADPAYSGLG